MAQTNPGFEVIQGGPETDVPEVRKSPDNGVAIAMVTIGLKALSQRALTAVTDLFTLITVSGAFYLWMMTPKPDVYQIVSLSIYALFTLAANYIVRQK